MGWALHRIPSKKISKKIYKLWKEREITELQTILSKYDIVRCVVCDAFTWEQIDEWIEYGIEEKLITE